MRVYEVQPGDTPAGIASRDEMAGCPRCAIDLVRSNPHKETVTHPNGYRTFRELRIGEKLKIPDKWASKAFDDLPPTYFAALPHPDGVTPSRLGLAAAGVLGNYQTIETAAAQVGGLAALGGREFSDAVNGTGLMIGNAIQEVAIDPAASVFASKVRDATNLARQINTTVLSPAIDSGDLTAESQARRDILVAFSGALENARQALQIYYDPPAPPSPTPSANPPEFPASVVSAAQDVISSTTTSYCASVARSGTPFNRAVHAFKLAWNASQSPQVPINTGNYEQETADALKRVLGTAPGACTPLRAVPGSTSPPSPEPLGPVVVAPTAKSGLSTGAVIGLSALGAGAIGTVVYFVSRPKPRRRRR